MEHQVLMHHHFKIYYIYMNNLLKYLLFLIIGIIIYLLSNYKDKFTISSSILFLPQDWPNDVYYPNLPPGYQHSYLPFRATGLSPHQLVHSIENYHNFNITVYEILLNKSEDVNYNIKEKFININYKRKPEDGFLYGEGHPSWQLQGKDFSERFGIEIKTRKQRCASCPNCCTVKQIPSSEGSMASGNGPLNIHYALEVFDRIPWDDVATFVYGAMAALTYMFVDTGLEMMWSKRSLLKYKEEYKNIIANKDFKTKNYLSQPLTWNSDYMLNKYKLEPNRPFVGNMQVDSITLTESERAEYAMNSIQDLLSPASPKEKQLNWIKIATDPNFNPENLKYLHSIENIDDSWLTWNDRAILRLASVYLNHNNMSTLFEHNGKEYWATRYNPYIQREFYDTLIFDLIEDAKCNEIDTAGEHYITDANHYHLEEAHS